MRQAVILAVIWALLVAGAIGRDLPDDVVRKPHRVVDKDAALPARYTQASPVNKILVTAANQILVELALDEDSRPNLFDLNERTLVFTPDGQGRYLREVQALDWEENIGEEVDDRDLVMLESFDFPFAGQLWDSFYLGPPGVLSFGEPFSYLVNSYYTMQQVADDLNSFSTPTMSILYKPGRSGTQHVARWPDRIVVTWITTESGYWVHGVRPDKYARFQTELSADGSIKFNYIDVPFGDGIIGFFPNSIRKDVKGDILANVVDGEGRNLLGQLNLSGVDLSQSENRLSSRHHEIFHYRSVPNTTKITCHLIDILGEEFDLFAFHREFRTDTLWYATPWSRWPFNEKGTERKRDPICGEGRLKGHWLLPVWIKSKWMFDAEPFLAQNEGFDVGSWLFAHEFAHSWVARYSYDKSGQSEPLHDTGYCYCHWRRDLHVPVAFPRHARGIRLSSIMGGNFWTDYGDGSFSPNSGNRNSGFAWLDLYAMGLADADEVPDTFILRNLQKANGPNYRGTRRGEKEIISIDQIVAAEGPRVPGPAHSQKVFNAGFVYLLEPGQTPSGDLLGLHARYRDDAVKYWSIITGGRSEITTVVPRIENNRPPRSIGMISARTLRKGSAAVDVEVGDYFSDPDGDPLRYEATSSNAEVAPADISGDIVKIKPGAAGLALLTVTAVDGRGGLAYQTIKIAVVANPDKNPADFTFVPVILSAAGRNNAFFTSELTLTNRGTELAILDFTYTSHPGGASSTVRDQLDSGRQLVVPDAVEFLRERGIPIPDAGDRVGTLRVATPGFGSSDIGITVRTTTPVPSGRAGLAYAGVPVRAGFNEPVYLCGLRQNEQDRSNVAFQHMGTPEDGPITLRVTVFSGNATDPSGEMLDDMTLGPGEFHQFDAVLATAGKADPLFGGYVKVERVEGTAPFYAYGVINDNANSDGSFVFPVSESSLVGTFRHVLPVILETGGFTSELTVTNYSGEAKAIYFSFVADGIRMPYKTVRFRLNIEAGEQQIIPDIIDTELRRKGVEGINSARGGLVGALIATVLSGNMSGIVIGARTGSPDGRGGQYSVFYNAVPDGAAFTKSAWIYGLQQNKENRSNLALVNTGEIDDSSSTFEITIYDGSGDRQPRTRSVTLGPRRWTQENGILGKFSQGYVQVRKTSGNNRFVTYGVINDGGRPGERSGDGAFLLSQE